MELYSSRKEAAPGRLEGGWLLLFTLAYCTALGLAVWRFWCSQMFSDYAVCGLLGQAIMHGGFPLFFYGQDFMGSLDGFLSAPLFAIFGPKSLVLAFWPPVLWLGVIFVTHRMLRMFFRPVGVFAGVFLLALPPAMLLCWAGQAQTHYPLALFLAGLLMLITAKLWRTERWGFGLPFAWGLVAGLAVWTNFMAAVVVLPCGLFLALFCTRRAFGSALLWGLIGALIGAGPLIAYNISYGFPHHSQGDTFHLDLIQGRLKPLLANALPLLLGFNPLIEAGKVAWHEPRLWGYLGVFALTALGGLGLFVRGLGRRAFFLWLPLMVAGCNLVVLTFSSYGRLLGNTDQRYFLPIYLCLPFAWAWLAQSLAGSKGARTWLGLLFVAGLAAVHVSYYATNVYCASEMCCTGGGYHAHQEPQVRRFMELMRQRGWHYAYSPDSLIRSFLSGDDPVFAGPMEERRASAATRVDASPAPVFVMDIRPNLNLLGLPYESCPDKKCLWEVFHSFGRPGPTGLGATGGWLARSLSGRDLGGSLGDNDLGTGFSTPGPAADNQGLVLDLGAEKEFAGFSLTPMNDLQVPAGLRIELAGEDGQFRKVREAENLFRAPFYVSGPHPFLKYRFGRTEAYLPPQKARFIRLTHLGKSRHPWSVGELLLYTPGGQKPAADWAQSAEQLMGLVRERGWKYVLADAWPSAVLRRDLGGSVRVVIPNLGQNDYGHEAKTLPLKPAIQASPENALVVAGREAERTAEALTRAGVTFKKTAAGRFSVFALNGRTKAPRLKPVAVSANRDQDNAAQLATGRPTSGRWGSLGPQEPGIRLTVDLGRPQKIGGFRLACPHHPGDYPLGLKALVSDDGQTWADAPHRLAWPLYFTGQAPMARPGADNIYALDQPAKARYLRLMLTQSHPVWWWSVERLEVLAPRKEAP